MFVTTFVPGSLRVLRRPDKRSAIRQSSFHLLPDGDAGVLSGLDRVSLSATFAQDLAVDAERCPAAAASRRVVTHGNTFPQTFSHGRILLLQQRQTRGVIAADLKLVAVDLWVPAGSARQHLFMLRTPITHARRHG